MGYGMVTIPTIINFYYTVIMAYAFYYLFMGFSSELPWSRCNDPDINTANCYTLQEAEACSNTTIFWNRNCTDIAEFCSHFDYASTNLTHCFSKDNSFPIPIEDVTFRVSASEEFWYKKVLEMSVTFTENGTMINLDETSWSHWGNCNWKIAGCLLLCWALVCLSLIKGVQSYGKVVYFTTLFPYVVLTTLLINVALLDGFTEGIKYYLTPEWSKLSDITVWTGAATQIFYSLGVAVGSQLLISSYNDFRANAHRDALIIGLCNSLTSIFAGFVVFGVVGFIANKKNLPIDKVVDQGPGLAFIVYPEAVASFPVAPLFNFMFFFMLVLLAMSSVCAQWEATIAAIMDEFPSLRSKRVLLLVVTCFLAFLGGFPICFQGGFLLFQLMDFRSGNAVLLMAFIELIIISWNYGIGKFYTHIEEMGMKIPTLLTMYWKACWIVITPLAVAFVTIYSWIDRIEDSYLGYVYPTAVVWMGHGIEFVAVGIVVLFSIFICFKRLRNKQALTYSSLMRPKANWGPRPDANSNEIKPPAYDNKGFET